MRLLSFCFALLLLVVVLPSCVPQPAEEEVTIDTAAQKEAAIKSFNEMAERWNAALNAGELDAVAELLTDDYVMMEPDRPAIEGKEAFLAYLRALLEENDIQDAKNVVGEVRLAGDWAVVQGTYTAVRTPKATGEPINITAKWVDIRELQPDGSWKYALSIGNRNAPLPATPE
jgi:uncharacterized protein (TIGR02246 family)